MGIIDIEGCCQGFPSQHKECMMFPLNKFHTFLKDISICSGVDQFHYFILSLGFLLPPDLNNGISHEPAILHQHEPLCFSASFYQLYLQYLLICKF